MMKSKRTQRASVSLLLATVVLVVPHLLLAQQSGLVPCSGVMDCQFCSVAQLIQNIINFLVQLSIPIAAALFAYAGFLYATAGVTGKTDQYKKATGIFSAVGIGFVLTLVGWLAVNTILSVLLGNGPYSGGKWFDIPCVEQAYRDTGANGTIGGLLNDLVSGSLGGGGGSSGPATTDITGNTAYKPGGGGDNGGDAFAYGKGRPPTIQDCKDNIAQGLPCKPIMLAASPDADASGVSVSDQLKGNVYTWDSLSAQYGLPAGTKYIECDKYAQGKGHGTFDVAVCHGNQSCDANSAPSAGAPPTKVSSGDCSTAGL